MRRIVHTPAVSAIVTSEVRAAILDGTLPPGSRIKQEWLAQRLGVSREPIRRALVVLEREGLVQRSGRMGMIVAPLDPAFIKDLYDFRGAIEGYVTATLAGRRDFDPAPLEKIIDEGRAAVASGDVVRLIELDLGFHTGLYEAVQNRVITSTMHAHWAHIGRVMAATISRAGYRKQIWDEHAAILDAIGRGQVSLARRRAVDHTKGAGVRLIASFDTIPTPATRSRSHQGSRRVARPPSNTKGQARRVRLTRGG